MKKLLLAASLLLASYCAVNAQTGVPGVGTMVPNTAVPIGVVQNNTNSSSAPTVSNDSTQGYSVGSIWQNSATGQVFVARSVAVGAAVWNMLEQSDFPTYVATFWYLPSGSASRIASVPAAPGAGSIRLFPGYIKQRVTLSALGVRVTTLSAAGNVQAAIYANNPATMRPTGNALASTANITTGATGSVNASVSVQLEAGLYWFATNCDNGTAIFASPDIASTSIGILLGSSTQSTDLAAAQTFAGLSVSQTFGTWPSLTAGSFTEVTSGGVPLVQFQAASTP